MPPSSSSPRIDLHSDLFLRVLDHHADPALDIPWLQSGFPALRRGVVTDQVFAIWVDNEQYSGASATVRALQMLAAVRRVEAASKGSFRVVRNGAEAAAARASGVLAGWLWLESGAPIANDPALLSVFRDLGIRGMTLTWTTNLPWAGSSTDPQDPARGLAPLGREIVREMNRLRLIVDVSHTSDATAFDAIALAEFPVVASHSGCRALCDRPRNVSDDLMRAIAETGGVLGVLAVPQFLSIEWEPAWRALSGREIPAIGDADPEAPESRAARVHALRPLLEGAAQVTIERYLDHLCHAVDCVGVEHVALGSDFDGIWATPVGMESAACWPAVAEGLARRGFVADEVQRIMGGNALRVLTAGEQA
jgi:membrane dipeptidase